MLQARDRTGLLTCWAVWQVEGINWCLNLFHQNTTKFCHMAQQVRSPIPSLLQAEISRVGGRMIKGWSWTIKFGTSLLRLQGLNTLSLSHSLPMNKPATRCAGWRPRGLRTRRGAWRRVWPLARSATFGYTVYGTSVTSGIDLHNYGKLSLSHERANDSTIWENQQCK